MTSGSGERHPKAPPRAIVIGGGIAGLAAAYDLRREGWAVEVHEADRRWGGKILSSPVGDRMVDAGPDTFLARVEPGRALCRDLGLEHELTSPVAPVPAYLVRDRVLHELPTGSMLGVPTDLDVLATSPLISNDGVAEAQEGLARAQHDADQADAHNDTHNADHDTSDAANDTDTGNTDHDTGDTDRSVGEVCREQLGDEITDRLIDPLLGGINASDIDRLSLEAGAPLLAAALKHSPSLIEGLRILRPASGPTLGTQSQGPAGDDPVFFGLPGGIARIIDALVESLQSPAGDGAGPPATLRLNSRPTNIDQLGAADGIVVATPAFAAAELLSTVSPLAAAELATIDYASVAQVTVELPLDAVDRDLDASGILFPRVEGTMITACTWFSTKWAHHRRPGTVLIRMTSGRFGDDRPGSLSDDELATTLLDELGTVIPISGQPNAIRVQRWPKAFPQYTPGHGARIDRIMAAVENDAPAVRLVGAAYRGIGIPACIDNGRTAARSLNESLA